MRLRRGTAGLLVVLLGLGLAGAGCSQEKKSGTNPRTVLAAAKRHLDTTSGVRLMVPVQPDSVHPHVYAST